MRDLKIGYFFCWAFIFLLQFSVQNIKQRILPSNTGVNGKPEFNYILLISARKKKTHVESNLIPEGN